MTSKIFQIENNYNIIRYDGEAIRLIYSDPLDSRAKSMDFLLKEGFKNISEDIRKNIRPFERVISFDFQNFSDKNIKNYSIISYEKDDNKTLPCWSFDHLNKNGIKDYEKTCENIEKAGKKDYVYNKIAWIGSLNSPTRKLLFLKFYEDPDFYIRILPDNWGSRITDSSQIFPKGYLSLENHTKYKYLLDLEGDRGQSTRLKFLMFSNRPIFMQERSLKEYWMWDLVPFVHYIPITKDLSDLKEKILWAEKNPEKREEIAKNALIFAKNNLKRKNAIDRISQVLVNAQEIELDKKINILWPVPSTYTPTDAKSMYFMQKDLHSCPFDNNVKISFLAKDSKPLGSFISTKAEWIEAKRHTALNLRNINYVLENITNAEWILFSNGQTRLDVTKIYNFLSGIDSNKNIVITPEGISDVYDCTKSVCRHMSLHDNRFSLENLKFQSCDTKNIIFSKELIRKIKNYKFTEELICNLNSFLPESPNQIIFLLSLILGANHIKANIFENDSTLTSFDLNTLKTMAVFTVNGVPAGIMSLSNENGTNRVGIYDHPNEFKFEIKKEEEISFFYSNGKKASILKKVKDKLYTGHPIDQEGRPNHGWTLSLMLLD